MSDGSVVHGEVRLGEARIWLHRVSGDLASPRTLTQLNRGLVVHVDDVDAHFASARDAGAVIDSEPEDQPYGQREYGALHLEGHHWWFATPTEAPARPIARSPARPPTNRLGCSGSSAELRAVTLLGPGPGGPEWCWHHCSSARSAIAPRGRLPVTRPIRGRRTRCLQGRREPPMTVRPVRRRLAWRRAKAAARPPRLGRLAGSRGAVDS